MSEQMRAGFEKWYSSDGLFPRSIERSGDGDYILMGASAAWNAWKAALATQPQAPQGAVTREQLEAAFESEIAKVSHVAYDSNEICRHFFNNIRTALCAAPETPEGKK